MMPGELEQIRRQTVSQTVQNVPLNDTVSAYQNDTLSYMTYGPASDEKGAAKTVQPFNAEGGA